MTPREAAKQAKIGTFDFGAPWNKITSGGVEALNLVCRPFNLESIGTSSCPTGRVALVIKMQKPRVGSAEISKNFTKFDFAKNFVL